MNVLAIHDGHNASAAVLVDGRVVSALQEERINRVKNFFGWPGGAIRQVVSLAGLRPEAVDQVLLAGRHMSRPPAGKKIAQIFAEEGKFRGKLEDLFIKSPFYGRYKTRVRSERIDRVHQMGFSCPIDFAEHHLCHASAVYHGMVDDDAPWLVLTLDGSGDGLCATVNRAACGGIERLSQTAKGESLGNIYSRTTFVMGFVPWEHEYKLMGMAPYASAMGASRCKAVFEKYLDLDPDDPLKFKRKTPEPTWRVGPRLLNDLRYQRFDWICGGLQAFTEDLIVRWVAQCIQATGLRRVALSGGVFMNVKANKRIMEMPEVDDLRIMPSCGDESNVFGAAYAFYQRKMGGPTKRTTPLPHVYLGPDEGSEQAVASYLQQAGACHGFVYARSDDIVSDVVQKLLEGEVVARCAGPMEFGARALGNRSILADPSNPKIVPLINKMIKRRDFWMPFAPVVLQECCGRYLVNAKNLQSPYMMLTFDTTEKREDLWAGLHPFDGTARAQMVNAAHHGEYYQIVKRFHDRTGRGVLLNTSLNLHGFPIVLNYRDAVDVFVQTGLRVLQIGNFLVQKR